MDRTLSKDRTLQKDRTRERIERGVRCWLTLNWHHATRPETPLWLCTAPFAAAHDDSPHFSPMEVATS